MLGWPGLLTGSLCVCVLPTRLPVVRLSGPGKPRSQGRTLFSRLAGETIMHKQTQLAVLLVALAVPGVSFAQAPPVGPGHCVANCATGGGGGGTVRRRGGGGSCGGG